jgi:3'(2'), 5'-bisphosphate nucleotidase/myo-inositol-1(or 4)-monophosphatase
MQLEAKELSLLADLACEAARAAGALIASYREREVEVLHKAGGDSLASQVVTEVDELSQSLILKHLQPTVDRYDLALLTEESEDDGSRHAKDYFWCIDPMDGTLPFTQGIPGYSVSIALVARDGQPMIGVVYDPVKDKLYRAVAGQGITINGAAWMPPKPENPFAQPLRFYCDCTFETHPDRDTIIAQMEAFAMKLGYAGLSVQSGGGGVLNACWVLEHAPACYFKKPKIKTGGGSLWDFAATACLFQEGGTYGRDFGGQALDLNRSDSTFMNHRGVLFTSDHDLGRQIRETFRR